MASNVKRSEDVEALRVLIQALGDAAVNRGSISATRMTSDALTLLDSLEEAMI